MPIIVIIVAGTIGAGKSTLTEMLAQDLETKPFMRTWKIMKYCHYFILIQKSILFITDFLFEQTLLAIKDAFSHDDNVLDRSIYEDSMLFHLNADLGRVSEVEVKQYEGL